MCSVVPAQIKDNHPALPFTNSRLTAAFRWCRPDLYYGIRTVSHNKADTAGHQRLLYFATDLFFHRLAPNPMHTCDASLVASRDGWVGSIRLTLNIPPFCSDQLHRDSAFILKHWTSDRNSGDIFIFDRKTCNKPPLGYYIYTSVPRCFHSVPTEHYNSTFSKLNLKHYEQPQLECYQCCRRVRSFHNRHSHNSATNGWTTQTHNCMCCL